MLGKVDQKYVNTTGVPSFKYSIPKIFKKKKENEKSDEKNKAKSQNAESKVIIYLKTSV